MLLDMEKTIDAFQWGFIEAIMVKLGFGQDMS